MTCFYKRAKGQPIGYIAWMAWAEKQTLKGRKQKMCKCCQRWYFTDPKK